MGCSPSSGGDAKSNSAKNKNIGTVDVEDPVSGQKTTLKFSLGKLKKDEFLMNLMNALFFGEDQNQNVDVCFQSLYFPGDDRYHYYMYRLLHVELESIEKPYSGKMWVLYLAGKPLDWDYAVNSNAKIDLSKGSPKLLWKYEKFPNPTVQQQGIVHQTSQTENLSYLKKFYEKKTIENQFTTKYDTSESNNLDYFLKTTDDTKFNTPASKNQGVLRNSSSNRNIALNNGETLSSYARRNQYNKSSSVVNLNVASSVSGKMQPNVPKNSDFAEKDNNCSRTMEDAVINTEESNNGMMLGKEKIVSTKRAGSNLRDVSIFNPDAKDRPNPNKIILSNDKGNTNVYVSNNQQRLNTDEDNRNIQAPLQTEAAGMNGDNSFDGFEGKRFANAGGQGGSQNNRNNNNNNNTNDMEDYEDNGIILPADLLPKKPASQIMLKNITLGTSQQTGIVGGKKKGLNETAE